MTESLFRYTLLSDGSSDAALLPILTWLLEVHLPQYSILPAWAELRDLPHPPKKLADRIFWTLDLFPCDLLFVHRDAEKESHSARVTEIRQHLESVEEKKGSVIPTVCVVPIRMQEAWMLINEQAIKNAANNPRNSISLKLPKTNELERIPDPKNELYNRLRQASGLHGRRLAKFNPSEHVRRVSEFISDFSILTKLPAFRAMQEELVQVIADQSWNTSS